MRRKVILSIILPAYNEETRIRDTLNSLLSSFSQETEFIVVDDGSTDQTPWIVSKAAKENPQIRLLEHPQNQGKGAALRSGFEIAQGDVIAFFDADGDIPTQDLKKLWETLKENIQLDVVIGSKRKKGSQRLGFSLPFRKLLARLGNGLIQLLLLPGIKDTQCGVKIFRAHVLEMCMPKTRQRKWSFDIELLSLITQNRFVVKEIPIQWHDLGDTRVKRRDYILTLVDILKIFWQHRILRRI